MIERVFGEITKELTQGFRTVEAMTINKFIYLLEALLPPRNETMR